MLTFVVLSIMALKLALQAFTRFIPSHVMNAEQCYLN